MIDAHQTPDPTQAAKGKLPRRETENDRARKFGIPKWLKQYNTHYAQGGVAGIIATHLQNPGPTLDHGRDRAARMGRREGMAPGCNPEDGFDRVGSIPTPSTNDQA